MDSNIDLNNTAVSLEDFDFTGETLDKTDQQWNEFINQINEGNVIPVIGPDLLTELINGQNYHQRLINKLAQWGQVTSSPKSFSQLVYDEDFTSKLRRSKLNKDGIYLLLNQLSQVKEPPHPLLYRLLATKQFPFVITTSFMPVVENCMRQIWGDENVRVLQFNNDSKRSMAIGKGDINNEKELGHPTIFYMFGKVSAEAHRYAVTDMDMMEFCKSWMSGAGVPRNIAECLKKRYLLFMGGSYSDWLFRFIWFSIRHQSTGVQKDNSSMFVVGSEAAENNRSKNPSEPNLSINGDSFERFLERIEAFTQNNPEDVISQIEKRLSELDAKSGDDNEEVVDVFISYSRSDKMIAARLCKELQEQGVKVWFDAESIDQADPWKQEISAGIHQTKLFVPLLTHNVEQEYMEVHEYREEWNLAAEIARKIGKRPFIIPVAQSGFDFYDTRTSIPEQFMELNATWYTGIEDMSNVTMTIVRKLEELNKLLESIHYGK